MSTRRRTFLRATAATAALGPSFSVRAAPEARNLELTVISHLPDLYHGWPTIARRQNGEILAVCSGGREEHVCPFGRVDFMRSKDEGKTWSFPRVVLDGPIDDRDAGVVETAKPVIIRHDTMKSAEPERVSPSATACSS